MDFIQFLLLLQLYHLFYHPHVLNHSVLQIFNMEKHSFYLNLINELFEQFHQQLISYLDSHYLQQISLIFQPFNLNTNYPINHHLQ